MHWLELSFSNCKGFAEAGDSLMRQVLLEVVQANEKVSIARLQTVTVEELFDQLDIADVCLFTLDLHAHCVVEGGHEAERL